MRAWVVDDEPLLRKAMQRQLQVLGCDVAGFSSADEVERKLLEGPGPDLLLCDYCLPGRDGLSIAQLVKIGTPQVRIIIATGAPMLEPLATARERGDVDYVLAKPWLLEDLVRALAEIGLARDPGQASETKRS
jgi:CheY-like chemotaxis protein